MGIEHRAHPRYDVHLAAEFKLAGRLHTARTRNVSGGGAALDTGHVSLKEGDELELSLFLVVEGVEDPDKPPLLVGARVQWVGESDEGTHICGLRFTRISADQQKWLDRFLQVTAA